ncbi:Leu/Phe/Val dehydrogenase [Sneathiella sp. HT1-7]|uniref:Leu/Phe/Val dehydrogenase n=1 Tax=Sneathiella sp. HT1-7 TaxID=2887192 RepID=UPI001D14D226|nr:Glu/Leu/Phe/Val dehydrogenase dimerization domain-containing protein [Sneathiella sp. HT1-7]MCC3304669.1 leucine dehydrogenase [Sneathiella sp. HT1-7]
MTVFSAKEFDNHEDVLFFHDQKSGLKAIIAVHDTTLGPALGGTRMWDYKSEEEAIADVLRLSRGMTYKSSLAGVNLGGGKSVIIGNAHTDKTPELFEAFGRAVGQLGGTYIAAEDVGTTVPDLEIARRSTRHIAGITEGNSGDPSPATAWGVFHGLRAAVKLELNKSDLSGVKVAVQGLGNVGYGLCELLKEADAELIVTDLNKAAVEKAVQNLGATAVPLDAIYDQEVDVFAPCALGAILNDDTIRRLKARVIAGSANNQLAEDRHAKMLMENGILYAPDYAINAGGIIIISHEGPQFDREKAMQQVAGIYDTCLSIFERAKREKVTTAEIADKIALERLERVRNEKAELALAS